MVLSVLSRSADRSHCVIWLSSPLPANTAESFGCHSTEVIGPECCLKSAPQIPSPIFLKSQTFIIPSSPPLTIRGCSLFQAITFTSTSCACVVNIQALWGGALMSHTRMVPSQLQEANTVSSFRLHCKSSTLLVCDVYGRWSTFQPPSVGCHRCIFLLQSPVNNLPARFRDQSIAKPSH